MKKCTTFEAEGGQTTRKTQQHLEGGLE